jgi:hypothetical protein
MSKVIGVRVDDRTAEMIDADVAARHMPNRSVWLASVIDRALVGAGRLEADEIGPRHTARTAQAFR